LLISGAEQGQRLAHHRNVIEAVLRAGVCEIVYTSMLYADTSPIELGANTARRRRCWRRQVWPTVINVTSGMGSFGRTHDPDRVESTIAAPLYTSSKAALTMLTTQYAKALPSIRFNAADPGYTATDLNGHRRTHTVTEGTDAIVALATEDADAGTGRVIDRVGAVPW
jgi:NAD(P)-dependent dehydrogenase (short-subunit alcohol dehydrogenase family)